MTVLMISGVLLRYTSSRNAKLFNRLLHGQFGLLILLIALIVLHVLTADD
jgi:surface polysaccharide O-acyltransferase-like enzyme